MKAFKYAALLACSIILREFESPSGHQIRKKPTLWSVFLCLRFTPDIGAALLTPAPPHMPAFYWPRLALTLKLSFVRYIPKVLLE